MTKEQMRRYMKTYRTKHAERYKAWRKEYETKNKERIQARSLAYRERNKEEIRKKSLEYYRNNREKCKASSRRTMYGITNEQYNKFIIDQNDKCKICGDSMGTSYNRVVDHDHTQSFVRGLLCRTCNCGLGLFKDNTTIVESALKYLKSYE